MLTQCNKVQKKNHKQPENYVIFTNFLSPVMSLMNNKNKSSVKLKIINAVLNSENKTSVA